MSNNNESIVSSTVETGAGTFNFSLLQGATLSKIVIGAVISLVVVVSVAVAGTVIGVRAQPSPPKANDDAYTTFKNIPMSFNPTSNDIAVERDNVVDPALISLDDVSSPTSGTIEWSSENKTVNFRPAAGFVGSEVLTYTISNDKRSAQGSINITVVNQPPQAVDDSVEVVKGTSHDIFVLENDSDADGDELTIVEIPEETNRGLGTISTDGKKITYVANSVNGADAFRYTISDGNATASARVTVTITNAPPIAVDDEYVIDMNSGPANFSILENDYDESDDPIHITRVNAVNNGKFFFDGKYVSTVSAASAGNVVYVPNFNFAGNDAFDYSISDGLVSEENEPSAVVSIKVIDHPPTAEDHALSIFKDEQDIEIPIQDMIADPNKYTCLEVNVAESRGTFKLDKNAQDRTVEYMGEEHSYQECPWTMTYTPEEGKSYTERVEYTVSDGRNTVSAFIDIEVKNQAPQSESKTVTLPRVCNDNEEDLLFTVDFNDILSDPDNDPVELLTIRSFSIAKLQGIKDNVANFRREKCLFGKEERDFTARDVQEDEDNSLFTINKLTIELTNSAPVCEDTTISIFKNQKQQDVCVLGSSCSKPLCTDAEGDPLSLSSTFGDGFASADIINDETSLLVKQDGSASGNYSVTYRVSDQDLETEAKVHVLIANRAPSGGSTGVQFDRKVGAKEFSLSDVIRDDDGDKVSIIALDTSNSDAEIHSDRIEFPFATVTFHDTSLVVTPVGASTSTSVKYNLRYIVQDDDNAVPLTGEGSFEFTLISGEPSAEDGSVQYEQGSQVVINVFDMDLVSDPDGDTIELISVSRDDVAGVSPRIEGRNIIYPSDIDYCGLSSFNYRIRTVDGEASATISMGTENCACLKQLDLVFVLDRSGSVGWTNWYKQIDFAKEISSNFDISNRMVHQAVYSYGWNYDVTRDCDFHSTREASNSCWDHVTSVYSGGNTATGTALYRAWQYAKDNGRADVDKVYILISDGASNNGYYGAVDTANRINNDPGHRITSVGVSMSSSGEIELENIAYNRDYYFGEDFDQLSRIAQQVLDKTCEE